MKEYKKPEWSPQIEIVKHLIEVLYSIPSGCAGGCCHIVTDDDNIEDDDIKWVINYCETDGKNRPDAKLSKIICEYLLELNYEQRALMFSFMNTGMSNDLDETTWNSYPDEYCKHLIDKWLGKDILEKVLKKEVIEYYWGNTNKPKIGQRVVISGTEYDIVAVSPEPYIEFDDGSKHYAMTVQKVGGDRNDVLYINDAQVDKE